MEEMDPTPRFEIAQHRPLGKITSFRGRLDESESSMQGLRGFVYEMKGTHTPPNEWCMAFQLSLRDGAVHWHRALSRKTKRTWSLLSDKFISYYYSQFSQSASTRYYRTKRSEKEHIRDYLN
ncbi:Eukaryotic/viral aspartic protease, partial [Phytophthora megakarya]